MLACKEHEEKFIRLTVIYFFKPSNQPSIGFPGHIREFVVRIHLLCI